jgi:transposase
LRKGNYEQQIALKGKPVDKLENKARAQLGRLVFKKFSLEGHSYYYVLKAYRSRNGKTAFLRLITTLTPARAMESYGCRYRIESMFRHLKSNGFELESLHVRKAYKVNMMMAALVLAYTLAVVYGLKKYKQRIAVKKHGSPEMSVFRYGLDLWQNHLQSFALFLKHLISYGRRWRKAKKPLLSQNVP